MPVSSVTTPRTFSQPSFTAPQRVAYGGDGSDRPRTAAATPVDTSRQASGNVRYGGDGSDLPKPLSLVNDDLKWKSVQQIAAWT